MPCTSVMKTSENKHSQQLYNSIVFWLRLNILCHPNSSKWHSIHRVSESDHRYVWKQCGRSHISYRLKLELYWPDPVYKYVSCMSNVSLICWLFVKNLVSTQKIWNHVQTVWEPDKSLFWLAANISTLRRFEGRRDLYSSQKMGLEVLHKWMGNRQSKLRQKSEITFKKQSKTAGCKRQSNTARSHRIHHAAKLKSSLRWHLVTSLDDWPMRSRMSMTNP